MAKTVLKPCPFCGAKAEFLQFAHPTNFVRVQCSVCLCGTDGFSCDLRASYTENKVAQAEIWNRRVGDDD